MKLLIYFFIFSSVFADTINQVKSIYGQDNRREVYATTNNAYKLWAKSVASMIPDYWLVPSADKSGDIEFDLLPEHLNLCQDQRFGEQIAISQCSAFLIGEDRILTAGHCVEAITESCRWYYWVFDFDMKKDGSNPTRFSKDQVYRCKKILQGRADPISFVDYAIILLDRKVEGRDPLPLRREGKIYGSDMVIAIGTPSGLPKKIAEEGTILQNSSELFFTTTLDTFTGNSGSPVINGRTGVVEGMLISGRNDYNYNYQKRCFEVEKYSPPYERGEKVLRSTTILEEISRH